MDDLKLPRRVSGWVERASAAVTPHELVFASPQSPLHMWDWVIYMYVMFLANALSVTVMAIIISKHCTV